MGEAQSSPFGGRQIIVAATAVTIIVFIFMMMGLRSCSTAPVGSSYTVIYSNMDLKDTANVITRLKELKIPYRIKDSGKGVAVPKDKADDARLGLAEKNLPTGGAVGWEIFDQTKLGATDFDRRIQFIRAISGELSRTINRISAVDDSRVQIVIPETKLFEISKAPVTASVLLKIYQGEKLTRNQINGIVHLVASSVENLRRENVTIIDTNGNILSSGGYAVETIPERAETTEKEIRTQAAPTEDKILEEVKVKKNLEDQLTSKVQSLITKMYPPNTMVARVNIDSIDDKKTTVIVLIDENLDVGPELKSNTFDSIAAAIGYDKVRGDRIIMKRVPFRQTGAAVSETDLASGKERIGSKKTAAGSGFDGKKMLSFLKTIVKKYGILRVSFGAILLLVFAIFFILPIFGGRKKEIPMEKEAGEVEKEQPSTQTSQVDRLREQAERNPEAAARKIISWVREENN